MHPNPDQDFAEWDNRQEAAEAADEARHNRLANAFISAARWGEDEPAAGLKNYSVGLALGEIMSDNPDLLNKLFYKAVNESSDPVWRSLCDEIGSAFVAHFDSILPKD